MISAWVKTGEPRRSDPGQVIQAAAAILERLGHHARVGILDNRFVLTSTNRNGQYVFTPFEDETAEELAARARSDLLVQVHRFALGA